MNVRDELNPHSDAPQDDVIPAKALVSEPVLASTRCIRL